MYAIFSVVIKDRKMKELKDRLNHLISKISPRLFFIIAYIHNRHRLPHFSHPKDLSEIWIKYVLEGNSLKLYKLADKFLVREFVRERGHSDILPNLLGVWDKPITKTEFDKLPDSFALKMNYGAGMNIICQHKDTLTYQTVSSLLHKWFYNRKGYPCSENHYNLITRKVICEEYIGDSNQTSLTDYKFICINGEPFCVLVCFDRIDGEANYMPLTLDWKPLPNYNKNGCSYTIARPKNLDRMVRIASDLAKGIELVRIDLYDTGEHIYFGEMTLTPAGCIFHTWSQESLDEMGDYYWKTKATFVPQANF